jgi:ResB-like family
LKTRKIIKSLASIRLGIIIIVLLGILTAWGTIVESQYNDAVAAQKFVYSSVYMYATMVALVVCLTAVMIDRWPWQKRHTGFVLAHIGIIVILFGALLTRFYGIDGSMTLEVGGTSQSIATSETVMAVYAGLGADTEFRKVAEAPVDFFLQRPSEAKPFVLPFADAEVKVVEFLPYAFREEKVVESDRPTAGAAIRFQLQNERVSLTEWMVQPGPAREVSKNLGPAQVIFTSQRSVSGLEGKNAIVIRALSESAMEYEIHTAREPKKVKAGKIAVGETIETGWMGLVLRMLKFIPHAEEKVTYKATAQATPMTVSAMRMKFSSRGEGAGKLEREYWLGLNSMARIFGEAQAYIVTYENARIQVDLPLRLKEFKVGRYQGTMRAASYESLVTLPDGRDVTISMNEPLKSNGYTFYQSSFQEDEQNRPVASILSVNRDPGRWIKYLGSLLIVLGTIHLFYFKRRSSR